MSQRVVGSSTVQAVPAGPALSGRRLHGSIALCIALAGGPALAQSTRVSTTDVPASQLKLPAPTGTIHWAVKSDGSVELSDRPTNSGGVVRKGVETYSTASDPASIDRARREREYWREQSEAFSKRQQQRDEELERARDAQALASAEYSAYGATPYYVVPGVYGARYGGRGWPGSGYPGRPGYPGGRPMPQPANPNVAVGGGAPTLGSPQSTALGGGPSPFLSSGFARGLHR